jgi:hypothetical protein
VNRRHPHTKGDDSCTYFSKTPSKAQVVSFIIESKTMVQVWTAQQQTFERYIDGDGGGEGVNNGAKVNTKHI